MESLIIQSSIIPRGSIIARVAPLHVKQSNMKSSGSSFHGPTASSHSSKAVFSTPAALPSSHSEPQIFRPHNFKVSFGQKKALPVKLLGQSALMLGTLVLCFYLDAMPFMDQLSPIRSSMSYKNLVNKANQKLASLSDTPRVRQTPLKMIEDELKRVGIPTTRTTKIMTSPSPIAYVPVSYASKMAGTFNAGLPKDIREASLAKISNASLAQQVYRIVRKYTKSDSEGMKLASRIVSESRVNNFDPLFVAAVVKSESGFNTLATSNVGAKGLMQIMPETGRYLESIRDLGPRPKENLTDPQYNLKLGINYLKHLEDLYQGNRMLTLIAYNWGPGKLEQTVQGKTRGVPREVMNYALKILHDHSNWTHELLARG